jgi:hypothetical protein
VVCPAIIITKAYKVVMLALLPSRMLESNIYELEQNVVVAETLVGITASNVANILLKEQRQVVHGVVPKKFGVLVKSYLLLHISNF